MFSLNVQRELRIESLFGWRHFFNSHILNPINCYYTKFDLFDLEENL